MTVKENMLIKVEGLFLKYGIKSITMDDISAHLGISKKTLYQHVDNKADLIDQIIVAHLDGEEQALKEIKLTATDAIDEMTKIARYVIGQLRKLRPTTVYDLQKYYKNSWARMESYHNEKVFEIIKKNIVWGVEDGLYRSEIHATIMAKLYVGKLMLIADEETFPLKDFSKENLFKEFITYHLHGITSPKGLKRLAKHTNNTL